MLIFPTIADNEGEKHLSNVYPLGIGLYPDKHVMLPFLHRSQDY